jgi:hypothetical protein
MLLLAALFLIIFKAVTDGFEIRGFKSLAGVIEFIYLAVITIAFFAWTLNIVFPFVNVPEVPLWKTILGFIFLRFAIFDLFWNISAGTKLFYIGKRKYFDQFWLWLISKGRVAIGLIWFLRFILFCISLAWLLNYKQ